jgi:hypothetical protein
MWIRFLACAAASEDLTSDCTRDFERWGDLLEPSATSRGKHSQSRVWVQRLKKGGWTRRLSGAVISETFPQEPWLESIGFVGDTPVSPSAKQESEQGPTTPDTCGLPSSSLFGDIDLPVCCLKTSQATSRWGCGTSCPIWKQAATERRGAAIRRRLSALHTDASESSSSGWPTPTVGDSRGSANATANRRPGAKFNSGTTLTDAIRAGANGRAVASRVVNATWPTPNAHDSHTGFQKRHTAGSQQKNLHTVVVENLPDFQADRAASTSTNPRAQLNPDWVEMLMGFPPGWTDCAPSETQ